MLVPVRGIAVNVGEQTGDGRYIVPGAVTHTDLPLPIGWLVDGDQHADMVTCDPTIGNITTMSFVPGGVAYSGVIDDENPAGAEAIRQMQAGSAPGGNRFFVSIDPDDYAVQLVDPSGGMDGGMVLMAASGSVAPGTRFDWNTPFTAMRNAHVLVAAAGGGDPMADGGAIVFEDAADALIARFTRLRIRGLTMCAVSAFAGSFMELDDGQPDASTTTTTTTFEDTPVTAAAVTTRPRIDLAHPPAEWMTDPHLALPAPLTITNEGRLLGHVAAWGTCHTGHLDRCVPPPRGGGYDRFHVGEVVADDGSRHACGVFAWGIPHADLSASLMDAWAHYSNSRYGFARVAVGEDAYGIWFSGALNPGISENDVAILRSLSMSGDWRKDPRSGRLSLIAALAVNFPGFPIPRTATITAAGGVHVDPVEWDLEAPDPYFHVGEDGEITSLVACGRVAPRALTADCGCDDGLAARLVTAEAKLAAVEEQATRLERRLTPLHGLIADRLDVQAAR